MKVFQRLFESAHVLIVVMFFVSAITLVVFAFGELWGAIRPSGDVSMHQRFVQVLECIGLLTIAVASLELGQTILEEETAHLAGRAEIVVRPFSSLLVHFAREVGANVIVRGLRAVADFEYEFQMTAMNQQLDREIETVFLMADPRHQAVASRLVKEIAKLRGDVTPFVPPKVAQRLLTKTGG